MAVRCRQARRIAIRLAGGKVLCSTEFIQSCLIFLGSIIIKPKFKTIDYTQFMPLVKAFCVKAA